MYATFKSDLIYNMDHMLISGTKPWSMYLCQAKKDNHFVNVEGI